MAACCTAFFMTVAVPADCSQAEEFNWKTWGASIDSLTASKTTREMKLRSYFIAAGSEKVFLDGRLLQNTEYLIDYKRGRIMLNMPLDPGDMLLVKYTRLPFMFENVYSLRKFAYSPVESPGGRVEVPSAPSSSGRRSRAASLRFGGMKSISFSMGSNRGISLDQAFKATVGGNITPSIKVKALLSDDNLPIQPEGNTQELEYLDKAFVEISGSKGRVSLGDFTLTNNFSTFSPIRREVKGAYGEAELKGNKLFLGGSSSKGLFKSKVFRGIEKLQGPYELLSQGRVTGEVILAGSEKVYLDGELLKRGEKRDYTIDYDRGTVTFTPGKLVTADSEISVDFEVTKENYERTAVLAGFSRSALPGGIRMETVYAREKDDAGSPRTFTLDEESRGFLEQAGDDRDKAIGGGVVAADPGKGDYKIVPEDLANGIPEHFEFSDSGDFNVIFMEVDFGAGVYILDGVSTKGKPVYRYAGTGAGSYVVGRRIPLPESHELVTARILRTGGRKIEFDMEYNFSRFDANMLSGIGDEDNDGDAAAARVHVRGPETRLGRLSFGSDISTITGRFKSFDRSRPSYFYRDWNLENETLRGREVLSLIKTAFERGSTFKLDYDFGSINRRVFAGSRHEGRFSYSRPEAGAIKSRVFNTSIRGGEEKRSRRRKTCKAAWNFWKIVPSALFESEKYLKDAVSDPDSGIAYTLYKAGISGRKRGKITWQMGFEKRITEEITDTLPEWTETRKNQTVTLGLSSRASAHIQGTVYYVHRVNDNRLFNSRITSDLARLNGTLQNRRAGMRTDVDYQISQNQTRTMQKSVIFVGEGKGDFNSLGEPVGKGRGDYMVVALATAELVPTHEVNLTWRLSLGKGKYYGADEAKNFFSWLKCNISLDQSFSVTEKTTYGKPWKVYLMFPSVLQRDASTLSGVTNLRQDWSFLESYKNSSLTLKYQRTDEEDNLFQGTNEERFFSEQAVKFDRSLSGMFTATLEAKRSIRRRRGLGLSENTGSIYDVETMSVAGTGGIRFSAGSTLDCTLEFARRNDAVSMFKDKLVAFKPSFVYRVLKYASIYGRYEVTRTLEDKGLGVKPIFFSSEGDAHKWSLTSNVRISKLISLVSTYFGRSEKGFLGKMIVEHNLKVETRAYF